MSIVRAPGVRKGVIGTRGFRAHCAQCGYLGKVGSYNGALRESAAHRKETGHTRRVGG